MLPTFGEPASCPSCAFFEEGHQPIDLAWRQRAAIRLAGKPRDDLPRARLLFRRTRRPAGEDPLAAGGFGQAGDARRALDRQVADVRQRGNAGPARPAARERPVVRPNQVFVGAVGLAHERRRDALLAGADKHRLGPDRTAAAAVGAAGRARLVFEQGDPLAVDGDIDVLEPGVRPGDEVDLEHVLAIGREDVVDDHAAAGAERRALDVVPRVLRHIPRVGVDRIDRTAHADRRPPAG